VGLDVVKNVVSVVIKKPPGFPKGF
jgi:hypothetical protein